MTAKDVAGGDSLRAGEREDSDAGGNPGTSLPARPMTAGELIRVLQSVDPDLEVALPERWNYEPGDAGAMITSCTRVLVTTQYGGEYDAPNPCVELS